MNRRSIWYLFFSIAVALGLSSLHCTKKEAPQDGKAAAGPPIRTVILIGVDGGDWTIIDPLIEKGMLPNFKKLVAQGASGNLRSIEPMLSPLLWTTIATGKNPEDHGILSFTVRDPRSGSQIPITSRHRRVDAIWNILGDYDRTVGVVGWMATWPAEDVNGVIVTDKVGYLAYASPGDTALAGRISPPHRSGEIERLVVKGPSIPYSEFERFLHIDEAAFLENRDRAFDPKNPVNNMILLYASTRSYFDIGMHLLEGDAPDFLGVYFEFVDATGHLFMPYAPPRQEGIEEAEYERFRDGIEEAYKYQDEILGAFMDECGDDTIIMIVSDHGFKSGDARLRGGAEVWAGKAAHWHRMDGIIALYGNGVKPGMKLENASLVDIAPTILALQGLPRAADMPGRILEEAFDPGLAERFNRQTVPTLGRARDIDREVPADGAASDDAIKKLEALGYIGGESPDAHNNLGQRYQKNGEFDKAIEEFLKAIELNPNMTSAMNNLAICYSRLGRYPEAEATYLRAIELNPQSAYAMNNLAVMYMEAGRFDSARTYGEMAIATEPNYANAYLTLGAIQANSGDLEGAEKYFMKVLQIEPENRSAKENLGRLKQQLDKQ
jgi:Flp pilus assembly protein TadD